MERLTLRDDDSRALLTPYGLRIYCSTQATADCICKLEEELNALSAFKSYFDKSIEHGKEHRKKYRRSKAIDPTCRNHGSCKWCEENRKHKFRDKSYTEEEIAEDIEETKDYSQLSYELLQKLMSQDKEAWQKFIDNYKKNYIEEMKRQIADLEAQHDALIRMSVLNEHMPRPVYKVSHACEMDVRINGN